jgi:hypothetical protein
MTAAVSAGRLTVVVRPGEANGTKSSRIHGEAEMYSNINHQNAYDRIADMHRQAQQDALARDARQGRQSHKRSSGWHMFRLPIIAARRARTA